MRILHVSSAKTFGGGERHLVELCRGLTARGHDVSVALRPTCEWKERLDFLPPENILQTSIRNSFGIFSAQKLARFISERQIDVVHAHVARDYLPASLACRMAGRTRFVLTRHVLFPMKPFHRFALKNVSQAVAVSTAVAESLQNIFPKEKITVIPNGIRVEDWSGDYDRPGQEFRSTHNIPADALLVGTVGELKELKGQRDFILAANEIAKKNARAYFVIVGKDNTAAQNFRRELKRLVKVFDLEDRFLFLDWVEETQPLLAALDVFVSASHSESFGLAILEAMASGTAIVSTETGGARGLLRSGETALIVPVKAPVELARAVEELLASEQKRRSLGEKAQILAAQSFGIDRMIEETEKLYRNL